MYKEGKEWHPPFTTTFGTSYSHLILFDFNFHFLACLFRRKSRAIVIAKSLLFSLSLLLSSCIIQKVFKVSTPNLEYLLIMTRCSFRTRGITLKAVLWELCPLLTLKFRKNCLLSIIIWKFAYQHETLNTCLSWHGAIVRQVVLFWK